MTIKAKEQATALLIIDIQRESTEECGTKPAAYAQADEFITTVNTYIEYSQAKGHFIIYIQHVVSGFWNVAISKLFFGGESIEGAPGTDIDPRVKRVSSHVLTKSKADAFSNPDLDALLASHRIREIELVGLDAAHCIYETALGGIAKGYHVTIFTDAVATNSENRWKTVRQELQAAGVVLRHQSDSSQVQ